MKQSKITAKELFMKMYNLREEVRELDRALEAVSDKCGTDSKAYEVLRKVFDEKSKEAIAFENKEFVEVFD